MSLYDSNVMLVLAALGRFLPLALLLSLVVLLKHKVSHDEAAVLAQRSPLRLPGRLREHAVTAALVYALTAGEYSASVLVAPPGSTPLAVRILGFVHFGRTGEIAAMSLLLLLIIVVPCSLLLLWAGSSHDPGGNLKER